MTYLHYPFCMQYFEYVPYTRQDTQDAVYRSNKVLKGRIWILLMLFGKLLTFLLLKIWRIISEVTWNASEWFTPVSAYTEHVRISLGFTYGVL